VCGGDTRNVRACRNFRLRPPRLGLIEINNAKRQKALMLGSGLSPFRGSAMRVMKSIERRRRHRRAVNALGRLVFTTLGPLTLGLLFAAYSPPAHADTVNVIGTFGTPGVDGTATTSPTNGGPGGDATILQPFRVY
jgi:hypothetical protein